MLDKNDTGLPAGLSFSDDCLPLDRPVIPAEAFFNLTRTMRLWLMPVIDQVLVEIFPRVQEALLGAEQQISNQREGAVVVGGHNTSHLLSVYSVSDEQIELLVMCLRSNGIVMDRPLFGGHLILEIYADNRIETFFSTRWDTEAVKDLSLDPATFVKRVMFCRYVIEPFE